MPRAIYNDTVIAESSSTVVVEGNHYFPPDSVNHRFLVENSTQTTCPWKGIASYYDVVVGGATNTGAAWYYPEPKSAAAEIKDHIAFWKGIQIED